MPSCMLCSSDVEVCGPCSSEPLVSLDPEIMGVNLENVKVGEKVGVGSFENYLKC